MKMPRLIIAINICLALAVLLSASNACSKKALDFLSPEYSDIYSNVNLAEINYASLNDVDYFISEGNLYSHVRGSSSYNELICKKATSVRIIDDRLLYICYDYSGKESLYVKNLSTNSTTLIARDIDSYIIVNGAIVYRHSPTEASQSKGLYCLNCYGTTEQLSDNYATSFWQQNGDIWFATANANKPFDLSVYCIKRSIDGFCEPELRISSLLDLCKQFTDDGMILSFCINSINNTIVIFGESIYSPYKSNVYLIPLEGRNMDVEFLGLYDISGAACSSSTLLTKGSLPDNYELAFDYSWQYGDSAYNPFIIKEMLIFPMPKALKMAGGYFYVDPKGIINYHNTLP